MSGRERIEGEEENEWRRKEEKVCLLDSAKETTGSFTVQLQPRWAMEMFSHSHTLKNQRARERSTHIRIQERDGVGAAQRSGRARRRGARPERMQPRSLSSTKDEVAPNVDLLPPLHFIIPLSIQK